MYFIFDTETSGLPARGGPIRGYFHPKLLTKYDSARLVSIAWIVLDAELQEIERGSALIRPNGFVVSEDSTRIHGITHQHAVDNGKDIIEILDALVDLLAKCKCIVAHNVWFDVNIFKSECYRINHIECLALFDRCTKYCTMLKGRELLNLSKIPTLALLYNELFGKSLCNAHDARYDTLHCCACFLALKHIPQRGPKPKDATSTTTTTSRPKIVYTMEQQTIIQADPDVSMLVLACPGSGKTQSIVGRIIHLIEKHSVNEPSIILTTFTRDAARQMKQRLEGALGRETGIVIGTIDAISLKFLRDTNHSTEHLDVSEYTPCCAALLHTQVGREFASQFKYLFVDEFQDINRSQFDLIKAMFDNQTVITAVGDDAQNIYSFRGSDVGYTLRFSTLFPKSKSFKLTNNFRSNSAIVDVANTVIEKKMVSAKSKRRYGEEPVTLSFFKSFEDECKQLHYRISDYTRSKRVKLNEIAVLCPQNNFLYRVEEYLTKHGIPTFFMDGGNQSRTCDAADKLCLSTIHRAKGLEWSVVFLIVATDNVYCVNDKQEYEGRNLFYVGVTRPEDALHISYSPVNGCNKPTRFINKRTLNVLTTTTDIPRIRFASHESKHIYTTPPQAEDSQVPNCWKQWPDARLHEMVPMPEFASNLGIEEEYMMFIRLAMIRMLGEIKNASYPFLPAAIALGSISVDYEQYMVYKKYRVNIETHLGHITSFLDAIPKNKQTIIKMLASPCPVDSGDIGLLLGLLKRMNQSSTSYNIPIDQVRVVGRHAPLIPRHIRDEISESFSICKDITHRTNDIMLPLWHVAKCYSIIRENRKRILHVEMDGDRLQQVIAATTFLPEFVGQLATKPEHDLETLILTERAHYITPDVVASC